MVISAVIGYGTAGGWHANVLDSHPDADLVAVCDPVANNREDAEGNHDVTTYDDFETLLEREDLDSAHVCSPPHTHLGIAETLLKAGIATLIEKPLTADIEDAERLVEVQSETGTLASVVHSKLFLPPVQEALDRVEDGEIGEVVATTMLFGEPRDVSETERGDWVFDLPGGELGEGFAHQVYLPLAFTNDLGDVQGIGCQNFAGHDDVGFDGVGVEATDVTGRQLVTIQALMNSVNQDLLYVYGTDGMLQVDIRKDTVRRTDAESSPSSVTTLGEDLEWLKRGAIQAGKSAVNDALTPLHRRLGKRDKLSGHHAQIDLYLDAVVTDSEPPVTLAEGLETVRVIEALSEERQKLAESPPAN